MKHNIGEVASLSPDYLGFIFWEGSPRHFNGHIPHLGPGIRKVGVFVDAPIAEILEKVAAFRLDAVQLHGKESPAYCARLKTGLRTAMARPDNSRDHFGTEKSPKRKVVELIKVFSIKDSFDFDTLKPYEAACDYYLFDSKGKLPGGNGYSFTWSVLENYPSDKPYFLSGGIGPDSLEKLADFLRSSASEYCYAIDVNSAFETKPGLKDTEKLSIFMNTLYTGRGPGVHKP